METLREMWASASDTVKVVLVLAVVVLAIAGLMYGLGLDWLGSLFGVGG